MGICLIKTSKGKTPSLYFWNLWNLETRCFFPTSKSRWFSIQHCQIKPSKICALISDLISTLRDLLRTWRHFDLPCICISLDLWRYHMHQYYHDFWLTIKIVKGQTAMYCNCQVQKTNNIKLFLMLFSSVFRFPATKKSKFCRKCTWLVGSAKGFKILGPGQCVTHPSNETTCQNLPQAEPIRFQSQR